MGQLLCPLDWTGLGTYSYSILFNSYSSWIEAVGDICCSVTDLYPTQCSRLENLRDGGVWWGAIYGVAQSQTRLKWLSSSSRCDPKDCSTAGFTVPQYLLISYFSHSLVSDPLQNHALQHTRLPCPSPTPGVYSNSCPWVDDAIQPCPLLLPSSIFPSIRVFSNESVLHIRWPNIGVSASASVLHMNIQDWFPLGWTGWISLQSKGLSRISSNTTVQKHQIFVT